MAAAIKRSRFFTQNRIGNSIFDLKDSDEREIRSAEGESGEHLADGRASSVDVDFQGRVLVACDAVLSSAVQL